MDDIAKQRYQKVGRFGHTDVKKIEKLEKEHLDVLYPLFVHPMLPTNIMHILANRKCQIRATTALCRIMKHSPNRFISQPFRQSKVKNARCAFLIFQLTDKGARALLDNGRISYQEYLLWIKVSAQHKKYHFEHTLASGYYGASFELGCRARGYTFLSEVDILKREKCPQATRDADNPLAIPYEINGTTHYAIPDRFVGVEYGNGASFFTLEADQKSEQEDERDDGGATINQKNKAYRDIIFCQTIKTMYGLPSLQVMFITTAVTRMYNFMQKLIRIAEKDGKGSTRPFLYKAFPDLADYVGNELPATGHIFTEDFMLAHGKSHNISKI
jgi:hypothetical protein